MLGLAIVCDDYMCVALERLCDVFLIREDVAGATFMAFGSAAPEIIINLVSTIKQARQYPPPDSALDATNMGVGAIIGSGMIAFLVIPGACALCAPSHITLKLKRRPLLRDITFYFILLISLYFFLKDGIIKFYEALLLVLIYFIYVVTVIFAPKIRNHYRKRFLKRIVKKRKSFVNKNKNKNSINTDDIKSPLLPASSSSGLEAGGGSGVTSTLPSIDNNDNNSLPLQPSVKFKEAWEEEAEVAAAADYDDDDEDVLPGSVKTVSILTSDESEGDDSESIIGHGNIEYYLKLFSKPLNFIFESTMPSAEEGCETENWYPLTFFISFIWVSFFSTVIGSCVARWTSFTPTWAKGSFFGLLTIAIGAEIPDTIQSVTMAKKGYGSMAVSNALGSQLINIGIGLGGSWLLATAVMNDGEEFQVTDYKDLSIAVIFQFIVVSFTFLILLGIAFYFNENKANLDEFKGKIMISVYICIIISYVIVMLTRHSGAGPCDAT